MPPRVSVIIPTFNCADFIEGALASAWDQYPNQEIIVVDDGSTDETVSLVRRYESAVRLIEQENSGAAAARNTGVAHATGDLFAFLDADDVWLPGTLSARVDHLCRNPDVGLVWGKWQESRLGRDLTLGSMPSQAKDKGTSTTPTVVSGRAGWLYPELLLDSIVHMITVVMRRSIFEKAGGFDESIRMGEDYDLWLRVSRLCPIHQLDLECALYRIHDASTTAKPKCINYELLVLERTIERFGRLGPDGRSVAERVLQARLAKLHFDFACGHLLRGDPNIARVSFAAAARHGMRGTNLLALWLEAASRSLLRCGPRHDSKLETYTP